MAESIVRLRVDSKEYDNKIKRAEQGLLSLERELNKTGKSFEKADKDTVAYIGALGKMQTVSMSARGKVGELSSAFVNLSQVYGRMTDEAKKGEAGKALSSSLEQIKQRTIAAKQELEQLNGQLKTVKMPDLGASGSGMFGGGSMSGVMQVFGGNMLTKVAGWAASFAAELGDCVKQGIELARQGEGVRIAFERLGRGDLLQGLREATHGTVTDLELMKAAVKFNDFKLPVQELGTMLAFAQQKAKDTGQSVDYMVDSIVTGLGRKSLMILDNLGLSAAEIKEKMKETGDMTTAVGAIIREQMKKAGDYVETAADKATQANVELENAMTRLGQTFQPLTQAGNDMWTSLKVGAINLLNDAVEPLISRLTEAGRLRKALDNINAPAGEGTTLAQKHLGVLGHYSGTREQKQQLSEKQLAKYGNEEAKAWREAAKYRAAYNRELEKGGNNAGVLQGYKQAQLRAEANARGWAQTAADYRKGLGAVLNPAASAPAADAGGKSVIPRRSAGGGGRTTTIEEVFPEGSMKALQKEMQELQKAQGLVTDAQAWKDYQQQIDEVTKKMNTLKGVTDADAGSLKGLSDEMAELRKERELMSDPISIAVQDEKIKQVQEEIDRLNGKVVTVEVDVDDLTPFEKLQESIRVEISDKNVEVDANSLHSLMKAAIENGIEDVDMDFSSLQEKMGEGLDIPDEAWTSLEAKINEKLKEMGIDPISLDIETGNLQKAGKDAAKGWQEAAGAISSVGSALQQVEDPSVKIAGIVAQAIANIALAFSKADIKEGSSGNIWAWIAATASGVATMVSTIASIKSATSGYAEGGIVKGTTYSGDQIFAGEAMVNAGELVLNKAQQGNLATALRDNRGGGGGVELARVSGEQIYVAMNNFLRRSGRGELVTWKY